MREILLTLEVSAVWQWLIETLGTNRRFSRMYSWLGARVDYGLLWLSRGWLSLMLGKPVALMTTIGRKSGKPRTHPILCIPDGQHVYLIASNFGKPYHPAWYLNIGANPDVRLLLRGRARDYVARVAADEEREHGWQLALQQYKGYDAYKVWATDRTIPIVILEPRKAT